MRSKTLALLLVAVIASGIVFAVSAQSQITANDIAKAILPGGFVNPKAIAPGAITSLHIKDNDITTDDIMDGTIATGDIADGAITGGSGGVIQDNSITADDIGSDAVGTDEIEDGAVNLVDLNPNAVPNILYTHLYDYAQGSTVAAGDTDMGTTLQAITSSSGSAGYKYYDADGVTGLSAGDIIYYDADGDDHVSQSDIRISAYEGYLPGSIVTGNDADVGNTLTAVAAGDNLGLTGSDTTWDDNTEDFYINADGGVDVSADDVRLTPVGDATKITTTETEIVSQSITPTDDCKLIVTFGTTPAEVDAGQVVTLKLYIDGAAPALGEITLADGNNYGTYKEVTFYSGTLSGGSSHTVTVKAVTNTDSMTVLGKNLVVTGIPA